MRAAKIDALLRAGAQSDYCFSTNCSTLQSLVDDGKCQWIQNFYTSQILTKEYLQVWATTDNPDLNHQVHKDAKNMGILVNVVDDQPYCDFITPSMIERGRVQLAISSGGASPVLIRNVRKPSKPFCLRTLDYWRILVRRNETPSKNFCQQLISVANSGRCFLRIPK